MFVLFDLMTEGGGKHFVILQRDSLQHEVFYRWMRCTKQRFRTTGALLRANPDNWRTLRVSNRFGHLCSGFAT
ncbi:Uncharacterised protein [Shigella sonnei]|nr:Uncharacterised protein [Shigella sonnei]